MISNFDPASERAVLAGVFQHGVECYLDICDIVTSETFGLEANKLIWGCFANAFQDQEVKKVDYPTLMASAKVIGVDEFLRKSEEVAHLRSIMNMPVLQPNVRRMAGRIRKLEISRLLSDQLERARDSLGRVTGDESIDDILQLAEGPIFDFSSLLTDSGREGTVLMGDGAEEYIQYLMDNPREMMGISTGLSRYDLAIGGGVRANSVDVIVARAKTGKTQLVDNISLHIAGTSKVPVFNIDTEMTKEEHLIRIAANMAGVKTYKIETGKVRFDESDKRKVLEAMRTLKEYPYYYRSVIGHPWEDILSAMRRWVTRDVGLDENGNAKPCVVIYDYIKLMSAEFLSSTMAEYQALGFIMSALKNFMGRYKVGCICFGQTNRDGTDREDETVVAGSDRIVHYCTSLSLYKRKTDEERAEAGPAGHKYTHKLIPLLGRHGPGLDQGDYINIFAEYDISRITEGPRFRELDNSGTSASTSAQESLEEGISL